MKPASSASTTSTVLGTYYSGKEKGPAAISRKVALAKNGAEIDIWGDGLQTRSFMYVDDCVEGLVRLMASDFRNSLNLGTDELISVGGLVKLIAGIAGKNLRIRHDVSKPQGVPRAQQRQHAAPQGAGWEPSIMLEQGLAVTYCWFEGELAKAGRIPAKATAAAH